MWPLQRYHSQWKCHEQNEGRVKRIPILEIDLPSVLCTHAREENNIPDIQCVTQDERSSLQDVPKDSEVNQQQTWFSTRNTCSFLSHVCKLSTVNLRKIFAIRIERFFKYNSTPGEVGPISWCVSGLSGKLKTDGMVPCRTHDVCTCLHNMHLHPCSAVLKPIKTNNTFFFKPQLAIGL